MLEQRVVKKVIVKKKMGKKRQDYSISYDDLFIIKRWILTGSFNNSFSVNENKIDFSKINLIRKASFSEPYELKKALLSYSKIAFKKDTLFITLILLSSGNFQAKKLFKDSFNEIVKTPNDLYKFMSLIKKYRGLGSIIHTAIKNWFKTKSVADLETLFVAEQAKYNWSGQDIVRMIKPKPRDRKENLFFKWLSKNMNSDDLIEYKDLLPKIYYHELLKTEKNIPIDELIKKEITLKMVPSNVYLNYVDGLKQLTEEEAVLSLKKQVDKKTYPVINKALKNNNLKLNILELFSLQNEVYENVFNKEIINNFDSVITHKIKKNSKSNKEVMHIVDMDTGMFSNTDKTYNLTYAVIASILTSNTDEVYSFSGKKIVRNSRRSIIEAEGFQENFGKITKLNIDKIKEASDYFVPKNIFVWSNRSFTKDLEKNLSILNMLYSKTKVCFINLNNSKLNNKNPKYFVVNGFNKNTMKIIKMIENKTIS
jgi:hypothetical protein